MTMMLERQGRRKKKEMKERKQHRENRKPPSSSDLNAFPLAHLQFTPSSSSV